MTKLCGIFDTKSDQIQEKLRMLIDLMKHDPKSRESQIDLAFGSIAIIKNQMFETSYLSWNASHTSCLGTCGHIVNTREELQVGDRTDTAKENNAEFLLRGYEEEGDAFLKQVNGVFAFAYANLETGSITIGNDRYGYMPLYYYHDDNVFAFASEVKSLLQIVGQKQLDWESLADFFYIGHMLGHKTLFKNIHVLNPGETITYAKGKVEIHNYYDFTHAAVLSETEVSTEKIATLFTEAVRRRIVADQPNTLLLSGGFDSRFILGAYHNLNVKPKLITLEHAVERGGADGALAQQIAHSLGLQVDFRQSRPNFFLSKECLEVFYILDGMIPTWELFIGEVYPELESSMGRISEGLGLGSALGGAHQHDTSIEENVRHFISNRRINRFLLRIILRPKLFQAMDRTFMHRLRSEIAKIPISENQFMLFIMKHRIRRRIGVNPYQLYASRVEAVTPATDIDFMEYVLSLPRHLRSNHKIYVEMLKKHFPYLTTVPIISGGSTYDFNDTEMKTSRKGITRLQAITRRISKAWRFRKALKKSSQASQATAEGFKSAQLIIHILEKKMFDRPFYNKKLLQRLFASYRNGNAVYHKLFKLVFYIELWHLLFIDEDSDILFCPNNFALSTPE